MGKKAKRRLFYGGSVTAFGLLAGIYLLARLAPAFATVGFWRPVVLGVGLLTMVGGGLRAMRQHDLKLLLAYGTVIATGNAVVEWVP